MSRNNHFAADLGEEAGLGRIVSDDFLTDLPLGLIDSCLYNELNYDGQPSTAPSTYAGCPQDLLYGDINVALGYGRNHSLATVPISGSTGHEQAPAPQPGGFSGPANGNVGDSKPKKRLEEDTYERKKDRAKFSRKEVKDRFEELSKLIEAPPAYRRANKAKLIEATIEYITKLKARLARAEDELCQHKEVEGGTSSTKAVTHKVAVVPAYAPQSHSTPVMMLSPTTPGGVWSLRPFLNLPSHPILSPQMQSSPLSFDPKLYGCPPAGNNGNIVPNVVLGPTTRDDTMPPQSAAGRKRPLRSFGTPENGVLAAREHPHLSLIMETFYVLSLLDSVTLANCTRVNRHWNRLCTRNFIWKGLCQSRWCWSAADLKKAKINRYITLYGYLHETIEPPKTSSYEQELSASPVFASGRAGVKVGGWLFLGHRSNSRTLRSVMVNGALRTMEVVELRLLVQNLSDGNVDCDLSSLAVAGADTPFQVLLSSDLFQPRFVSHTRGFTSPVLTDRRRCPLRAYETGVISFYVLCPGSELEIDFLMKAHVVQCSFKFSSGMTGEPEDGVLRCQLPDAASLRELYGSAYLLPK